MNNNPKDIQPIQIKDRWVGPGYPVYIIAEMSANHQQDFDSAVRILHAAKESGADAVKLQTYTPDTITLQSSSQYFQVTNGTLWDGKTLYDLYKEAFTPWEWQPKLKKIADQLGLDLFSSAFDATAVDFLEEMNTPVHKIASFEIVDLPLIEKMAKTKKPLIISTGIATFKEIEEAVQAARNGGITQIALLKCSSTYPAEPAEMNLRNITTMLHSFKLPIGLSDHTLGTTVAAAAISLGACMIEKHLTLSRDSGGPDGVFSLEPTEFKELVKTIRMTEQALGTGDYFLPERVIKNRVFRRSLFVVEDMQEGEVFTEKNIRSIRPGYGLEPKWFKEIVGLKAVKKIEKGTPLNWDLVLGGDKRKE